MPETDTGTLVGRFLAVARSSPDRLAFREPEGDWTYGQAAARIRAMVAGLRRFGVEPGQRVLLWSANTPDLAMAYFAVHGVGGVAVPVDASVPPPRLAELAEIAEPALLVGDAPGDACKVATMTFAELGSDAPTAVPASLSGSKKDLADLLFTSGTTGAPKGVLLTHTNIFAAAAQINQVILHGPEDLEVVPVPLAHSFGLGRLRCMALAGNALQLEKGLRNAPAVLARLLAARATGLALVPSGFDLLRAMTRDRLGDAAEHLRYIEIGSAPMPAETREWLMERLPDTRIYHHYGLTEASRSTFTEYFRDGRHGDTIGLPTPGVEIVIREPAGDPVAQGEVGELTIRGPMVMEGYWKDAERTAEVLIDGTLHTGDLAYRAGDGYLYLVGRKGALINVGGLKVSPVEVEQVLDGYNGIRESMCLGAPDPRGITGQIVRALVVCERPLDFKELNAWLRERLEEYKIPRQFEAVTELPKTASGKLLRNRAE